MADGPRSIADIFGDRPTLVDLQRQRYAPPKVAAGQSRRELNTSDDKAEEKAEKLWHKGLKKRDGDTCRWCQRRVVDTLDRVNERREHHHINGRVVKAIRWMVKNGLQLCGACHDRVTGKVNERFLIHSKHKFTVDGVQYIDGDKQVRYQRVA